MVKCEVKIPITTGFFIPTSLTTWIWIILLILLLIGAFYRSKTLFIIIWMVFIVFLISLGLHIYLVLRAAPKTCSFASLPV